MSTHVYRREGGEKKVQNSVYVECERPLSEFRSHFCHSREGDTSEFEVGFKIRAQWVGGTVVNWA